MAHKIGEVGLRPIDMDTGLGAGVGSGRGMGESVTGQLAISVKGQPERGGIGRDWEAAGFETELEPMAISLCSASQRRPPPSVPLSPSLALQSRQSCS